MCFSRSSTGSSPSCMSSAHRYRLMPNFMFKASHAAVPKPRAFAHALVIRSSSSMGLQAGPWQGASGDAAGSAFQIKEPDRGEFTGHQDVEETAVQRAPHGLHLVQAAGDSDDL